MKTPKANGHAKPDSMLGEFLKALGEHESRETERHERLMAEIQKFRSLALGVVSQRTDLDKRVKALEDWKRSIEEARS